MASEQVTLLLKAIGAGEASATDELLPLVYAEMKQLARSRLMNESPDMTLQATALVHEAYLKLMGHDQTWENRAHFFGAAAIAMRRILVDRARKAKSQRHGGAWQRVTFATSEDAQCVRPEDLLDLDQALTKLSQVDARMTRIVMLRYFAGLSIEETSQAMGVSQRTVKREWSVARVMLRQWMSRDS